MNNKYQLGFTFLASFVLVFALLLSISRVLSRAFADNGLEFSDIILIGLPKNKELNMVFQFELMDIDSAVEGEDMVPLINKPWKLSDLKDIVRRWQTFKREEGFWNA